MATARRHSKRMPFRDRGGPGSAAKDSSEACWATSRGFCVPVFALLSRSKNVPVVCGRTDGEACSQAIGARVLQKCRSKLATETDMTLAKSRRGLNTARGWEPPCPWRLAGPAAWSRGFPTLVRETQQTATRRRDRRSNP